MKKIALSIVVITVVFIVSSCGHINTTVNEESQETDYTVNVSSDVVNKEECCICGNNARSMMDYYRKSGMVGLVCLNTMNISNLDTRLYSDDGVEVIETEQDGGSMFNTYDEGKVSIDINGMETRGIFEATIHYDKESKIDFEKTKEFLCQDCLDKVTNMYKECMEWTDGKGRFPQVCLVDFATNELYPLSSHEKGYDIRDFRVHIEHEQDSDEVLVIYAPKQKMG